MPKYKGRYLLIPSESSDIEYDLFEKFENSLIINFLNLDIKNDNFVENFKEIIRYDLINLVVPIVNNNSIEKYEDYDSNINNFSTYLLLLQNDLRNRLTNICPNLINNHASRNFKKILQNSNHSKVINNYELDYVGTLKYLVVLGKIELSWKESPIAIWQIIMRSFITFIQSDVATSNLFLCQKCNRLFYPSNSKQKIFCSFDCGKKFHGSKKRPNRVDTELKNQDQLIKSRGYGYARFALKKKT